MKRIGTFFLCLLLFQAGTKAVDLKLWYEKPAQQWVEALPVGNGSIGAMIYGGVEEELIQLNEGTLWSGGPQRNSINPEASNYLKLLREALAAENYDKAHSLSRKMQGYFSESFMPMGDLHIKQTFKNARPHNAYKRELDLNNALATTEFYVSGVKYTREVFTSAADRILVVKITSSRPEMLVLDIALKSLLQHTIFTGQEGQLNMNGNAPAHVDPNYYNRPGRQPVLQEDPQGCRGMRFQTILKAVSPDGTVETDEDGIHVKDASEVILYLSAATSFNGFNACPDREGKDEKAISQRDLEKAQERTYEELKQRHVADYQNYFDRLSLTLSDTANSSMNRKMPSDFRLKLYSYGNNDPELEVLYFQYGRYLLISSSRPGGSAVNLQGLWNKEMRPPWSSNYTININTQMNYWPAESANLSEMHRPLLDLVQNLSHTGKQTAKEFYNSKGWVAHHNTDIWAISNPVGNKGDGDPEWANWAMGGNWLCQHLWEHYSFTGDLQFLKNEAYPVMKQAALFCFDWLIEKDGYLITSPSVSPENLFWFNNKKYAVSEASTMDMAIIWDLFTNLIEASEILDTDKRFRTQLIRKRDKLYPPRIGSQGQLLEWSKEYKEVDPQHRHVSHLFGLHPGRQISPLITPELAKATEKTFELRGDAGTGWSKGWKINFAARQLNGDHAYKMIREIMSYYDPETGGRAGGTYPNFFDAHPPFQIDGNFGATAGFIEMLLQSHLDELHVLPALPQAWPEGKVTGMKARGNFEVDIEWEGNCLKTARIKSNLGNTCRIRTEVPVEISGVKASSVRDGKFFLYSFETEKNGIYRIKKQ